MKLNSKFKIQNSGDEIPNSNFKIPAHILGLATLVFFFLPLLVNAATLRTPPNNLGLVGYWSMEDGSGTTATDFSGNGNDGTLNGSMTDSDWVSGKRGTALDFDGSDDYVDVGTDDVLSFGTGNFAYSFWIKTSQDCSGNKVYVGQRGSSRPSVWLGCDGNANANFEVRDSDDVTVTDDYVTTLNDGQWHHVVGVKDGHGSASVTTYVDGKTDGPSSASFTGHFNYSDGDNGLQIGEFVGSYNPDAKIDEVRIYNRALSASEVKDLYQSGYSQVNTSRELGDISGLVGWWTFDGPNMVTNVADASGNGNDGKLKGQTSTSTVAGRIGQALEFDGSDDWINAGSPIITLSDPWTATGWVEMSTPISGFSGFFGFNESGAADRIAIGVDNSSPRKLKVISSGETGGSGSDMPTSWTHVAIRWDGTEFDALMNGILDYSVTPSGSGWQSSEQFEIGRVGNGTDDYANSKVDDVRIYDRALTNSEIQRIYNATRPNPVNTSRNNRLTDGLVGQWSFDGPDIDWSTQTATDSSGNGNDGTITNMSTTTSPTPGKIGQALEFERIDNNNGDFIDITNFTAPNTAAAWVKAETLNDSMRPFDWNINEFAIRFDLDEGMKVFFGGSQVGGTQDNIITAGEWYHFVLQYESGDVVVYKNGQEIFRDSGHTDISGTDDFVIGQSGVSSHYWDGIIDDVRVYDRALSAEEVKQLYRLGQ